MADAEFLYFRYVPEPENILVIDPVSCMDSDLQFLCKSCRGDQPLVFFLAYGKRPGFRKSSGMEFNVIGFKPLSGFDVFGIGVYKKADGNTASVKLPLSRPPAEFRKGLRRGPLESSTPGAFRGPACHDIGFYLLGDFDHLFCCRHLQVHFSFDGLAQDGNVPVLDVAAVFPEVNHYSMRARKLG